MARDILEKGYVTQSGYLVVFAIAGIGGAALSMFYYEFLDKGISITVLALAFLVGYAVDSFVLILDRFAPIIARDNADVREDLIGVNGSVERSISDTNADVVQLNSAEQDVSVAYGRLNPLARLKLFLRVFSPYMALLIGFSLTNTFDVLHDIPNLGKYVTLINTAYAQSPTDGDFIGHSLLPILSKIVFLIMFVVLFIITIRDEFFSKHPRSISKDLNRAFTGFIIGQITKFVGA